jgi:hypothetical protein
MSSHGEYYHETHTGQVKTKIVYDQLYERINDHGHGINTLVHDLGVIVRIDEIQELPNPDNPEDDEETIEFITTKTQSHQLSKLTKIDTHQAFTKFENYNINTLVDLKQPKLLTSNTLGIYQTFVLLDTTVTFSDEEAKDNNPALDSSYSIDNYGNYNKSYTGFAHLAFLGIDTKDPDEQNKLFDPGGRIKKSNKIQRFTYKYTQDLHCSFYQKEEY